MVPIHPSAVRRPPAASAPKASPKAGPNISGDLAALRRRIAALERRAPADGPGAGRTRAGGLPRPWRLGMAVLDAALPAEAEVPEPGACPGHDPGAGSPGMESGIEDGFGGLAPGGLHEAAGGADLDGPAALAFLAALLVRLGRAGRRGPVAVCQGPHRAGGSAARLYGPGWRDLGLDPGELLLVGARRDREMAWAMEECLRSGALAAVLGETGRMSFVASRRLALAARESRTPALLLRGDGLGTASAACSRWRVTTLSPDREAGCADPFDTPLFDTGALGRPRWRLELLRCRGGRPATCDVEWNRETGDFGMAAALADRPAAPRAGRRPVPQPAPEYRRARVAG